MQIRTFTLIAFIARNGAVCRLDHQEVKTTLTHDAPLEIIRTVSAHRARGRSVICLEDGSIRRAYTHITPYALDCLRKMRDAEYIRFIRHAEPLRGLSRDDFIGHLNRTFAGA